MANITEKAKRERSGQFILDQLTEAVYVNKVLHTDGFAWPDGKEALVEKWEAAAVQLNATCRKNWTGLEWRAKWKTLVKRVRMQNDKLNASKNSTGERPKSLNERELKVLKITEQEWYDSSEGVSAQVVNIKVERPESPGPLRHSPRLPTPTPMSPSNLKTSASRTPTPTPRIPAPSTPTSESSSPSYMPSTKRKKKNQPSEELEILREMSNSLAQLGPAIIRGSEIIAAALLGRTFHLPPESPAQADYHQRYSPNSN